MRAPSFLSVVIGALLLASAGCGRGDVLPGGGAAGGGPSAATGGSETGAAPARGRVVLFGVDGADWRVIEPLAARGRLPAFKRLLDGGATGTLMSMQPSASPSLWTTIATGVRPERHGIFGFVTGEGGAGEDHGGEGERAPAQGRPGVHPVTSTMRRAPAFWNILQRYDRKVGVVGWLVTWPAEPTNGYIVSSYLPYVYNWSTGRPLKGTIVQGIPKQTFPEALIDELEPLKVKPAELSGAMVRRFYDPGRIASLSASDKECVEGFLWSLACDETYGRIGRKLRDEYPADLFAIYFGGVDVASHRFWKFAHPEAMDYGVKPDEAAVLGGVIDAYYAYVDGWLGDYLDRIPADTTVIVLSDHGFKPVLFPGQPATSGHHRLEGVIGLYGRGVRPGARIEGAGLVDVLPTVLRLLDVPLARDLEGKALEGALAPGFLHDHPAAFVDTYGGVEHPSAPDQSDLDRNVLERLRSLGYIH